MAGTVVADTLQADSTSTLVIKNGVANTPPTIQDSAGTQIGTFCRAWVNFNGTTVTSPASMTGVNGSFNVSSVLDGGLGIYTINFTNALPDTNYAVSVFGRSPSASATLYTTGAFNTDTKTTLALQVRTGSTSTLADSTEIGVAIFR